MKCVAASEHALLSIARALVGDLDAGAVEPLLRRPQQISRKPDLGPTAVALLKQILSRGTILELCRRGGWREARHLRGGQVVSGRLWAEERGPPPALHFSRLTMKVCRWLTASPLAAPADCAPLKIRRRPTPGDQLVLYLACDLARRCGCAAPLASSPAFRRSALCWLGFAGLLSPGGPPSADELQAGAFRFADADVTTVLEALQQDLARRWRATELSKGAVADPRLMIALGQAQRRVVDALVQEAEAAGRRDVTAFLLEAGGRLLRHRPPAQRWVAGLSSRSSLRDREAACRGAGTFLQVLEELRAWADQSRATRFFDEDYDESQLLLRQWEQLGDRGQGHARRVREQLESLDASLLARGEDEDVTTEVSP